MTNHAKQKIRFFLAGPSLFPGKSFKILLRHKVNFDHFRGLKWSCRQVYFDHPEEVKNVQLAGYFDLSPAA